MTTDPPLKASWLLLSYDEFKSLKMNKKFNILKKKTFLSIFSFFLPKMGDILCTGTNYISSFDQKISLKVFSS